MQTPDPADPRPTPPGAQPPGAARRPAGTGGAGERRTPNSGGADERRTAGGGAKKSAGERVGAARERLGVAGRKVGRASRVGATGVAAASRKTATVGGRFGRWTGRRISGLTGAQGARESGLSRLIELGAVNAAGDTAFAVSLAGTVFFTVPSDQARDRVALFLLLTMAPFALMAPLIGPILDRFRHGRRWAIGATLGARAFLVWGLAGSISDSSSVWLYPAALGCLVASKAYGVTRASAVPRLLPREITLVTANSRISLAGVAGATIGAGIAGAFAAIGPQWSLRWAALVYVVGLILAIRLPAAVDSPAGEEVTGTAGREMRRKAITEAVARGIRCNLGLRFVSGFLTMYLAFLLRDEPISGLNGTVAAGAVVAAAGLGNSLGTLLGSLLKARKPEAVVLVVLLADATVAILVAVLYGFPMLITLGLVAGLCSSLGKLSLDAMIQRDVPETVRTSVFARSETVLQLSWVIGGGCGIVLPLIPRLGFGFLAAVLLVMVFLVLRMKPSRIPGVGGRKRPTPSNRPPAPASAPSARPTADAQASDSPTPNRPASDPRTRTPHAPAASPAPGGAHTPDPHDSSAPDERDDVPPSRRTTRTVFTSIAEQRAHRAAQSDAPTTEPTIEVPRDQTPPQPVGQWWSGQPDDDTREEEAPWSQEPTVENTRPHDPPR